ncbi:MAG TPA: hypothetical protein VE093_16675 [Polyangiaceae bacterium]|jgi:hypothetical protein|nr:hypothetical protein [Polyangiaceae bacterium]
MKPPPRCPICGVGITASGRNQPVAVDEADRPYCRTHGHLVAPEYDALLAEYERTRAARARLLEDAAAANESPTVDEVEEIRLEWRRPA